MRSYYKEAAVGGMVILGLLLFLGGGLWLRGGSWNKSALVPIAYENIGNLKQGAPVRISGAPIGRVEGIEYLGVGHIVVRLDLDKKKVVPTTAASAKIVSVGMLGDAMIDFLPGEGSPLTPADTIKGTLGGGDLMDVGTKIADKASMAMDRINAMLDTSLVISLKQTLNSTNHLMAYLADTKTGPTAELNNTLREVQKAGARLDTTLASVDFRSLQNNMNGTMKSADSTMRSVSRLSEQAASATKRLDGILADLQGGKGSMGRMMSDTMLYHNLNDAIKAFKNLTDEIAKNPGKISITVKIP